MADDETTFEPELDDYTTDLILKGVAIGLVAAAIVAMAVFAFDLSVDDALVSVALPLALVALGFVAVYVVHMLARLEAELVDVRRRLAATQTAVRDLALRGDARLLERED